MQPHDTTPAPHTHFWSFVDKTESCWLWRGYVAPTGYGMFWYPERKRTVYAHRVAYELKRGPIPASMEIDHICRVRNCVRPDHLEVVTTRENLLRSTCASAKHAKKTHCPKGHPYDRDNTYLHPDGSRRCRICRAEWHIRHRAENNARAAMYRAKSKAQRET